MDLQQRQDERQNAGREATDGVTALQERTSDESGQPGVQLRSMHFAAQQERLRPTAPVQLNPSGNSSRSSSTSGPSNPSSSSTNASNSSSTSTSSNNESGEMVSHPRHEVFSHAKAGSGAEIQTILDSGLASRDQIKTMLDRSSVTTAALLQQKCTEFGNWTHVGLYFGSEADYAASMGTHFTTALTNLSPAQTASATLPGGGATPAMGLDIADSIEQHLVMAMTPYAPPSLAQRVNTVWPQVEQYRTLWSEAIQDNITATTTLASNIVADPMTYWPTQPPPEKLPGYEFYENTWNISRNATRSTWAAAWQGLMQHMNQVVTTAIANANTYSNNLVGGAALQPDEFYGHRDLLNRVLDWSQGQHTATNQAIERMNGIESVRTDARIQPHATTGQYMIPEGELRLYVNQEGRTTRGSFSSTLGLSTPSNEEIGRYISRRDVIQGGLANCFLSAVLSSVANTNPSLIANAITEPSPGTFNVNLYQPQSGGGPPPTGSFGPMTISVDHQLPHYDNYGQQVSGVGTLRDSVVHEGFLNILFRLGQETTVRELWPVILEKAIAKAYPNGYRSIGDGGADVVVFEMLTGRAADPRALPSPIASDVEKTRHWNALNGHLAMNLPVTAGSDAMRIIDVASGAGIVAGLTAGQATNASLFNTFLPSGTTDLSQLIASNNIAAMRQMAKDIYNGGRNQVQSATMRPIGLDAQVYPWHVYSILSTRETHDPTGTSQRFVGLRNPWGIVTPDRQDHGEFELTFDEFLNRFGSVTYGHFNTGTS